MSDSMSMLTTALSLPEQFRTAVSSTSPLEGQRGDRPRAVLIAGMGGSGVVGDMARALLAPTSPVPVVITKTDECPAFVDRDTLVIIASFSGTTAESRAVMADALERGATIVAITTGGTIGELAESSGSALWTIDDAIPCPRAALAALAVPALRTLDHYGLFANVAEGPLDHQFDQAIAALESRRDELSTESNVATTLARRIGRTMPLVYGAGLLGEAAATRWKCQFNENPKVPAFIGVVPEITHNEICGWAQHGDMTRQVFTLVSLRHSHEGPRNSAAMDAVNEITEETVAGVHEVEARGTGRLAQLFDLSLVGDLVSLHMAINEGIDPGPVPILEDLKARLGT